MLDKGLPFIDLGVVIVDLDDLRCLYDQQLLVAIVLDKDWVCQVDLKFEAVCQVSTYLQIQLNVPFDLYYFVAALQLTSYLILIAFDFRYILLLLDDFIELLHDV